MESQDALYLIALEEIIPDHPPTLDEVRPESHLIFAGISSWMRHSRSRQRPRSHQGSHRRQGIRRSMLGAGTDPGEHSQFSLATRTLDGLTDRRVTVSWLQDLAFAMDPGI